MNIDFNLSKLEALDEALALLVKFCPAKNTFNDTYRDAVNRLEKMRENLSGDIGCSLSDEIKAALLDAKAIAMKNTIAARIPESGDFGGIAQNLAYVCEQLGIKDI